jgi:hypothetical protein
LGIAVAVGRAEEVWGTGAAGTAATIAATFLAGACWLAALLAVAIVAEESGGALAAASATAVGAALVTVTIGLAAAHAFGILAVLSQRTGTAGTTTAIAAALLACTFGLADSAHALPILAALAVGTTAAGAAAAVTAASESSAIRYTGLTTAAPFALHFADTNVVPHGFAAVGIEGTDTSLNIGVRTAWHLQWRAAVAATCALTAIPGADFAVLSTLALSIAAGGARVALATAK